MNMDSKGKTAVMNSDLKSDVSKRISIKTTEDRTSVSSAKQKSSILKKSKGHPTSEKQAGQSKTSKEGRNYEILTQRKQAASTGASATNVSKKSKTQEKTDRSAAEKHAGTSSGNVSKKCDIHTSGKQSKTKSGNVSNKSESEKCNISASERQKETPSANVSKKCDIPTTGKQPKPLSNNDSKKCKMNEKCNILVSEKQSGTPSGNVSEKCHISASDKHLKQTSNKTSKKSKKPEMCEIPTSERPSGNVLKKTKQHGRGDLSSPGKQPRTSSGNISQKSKQLDERKALTSRKTEIILRPSDIRYSQSSISSSFQDGTNIGQLLDDIFFGRCFASALPQIEVSCIKDKWVSADNRRLWVFKQLEILGRIEFINVKVTKKIYGGKLTSENNGLDVEIRNGSPKGVVYSLMHPDSEENIDECPTKEAESAPDSAENKRKRTRRCRRRRKTKLSGNDNNNLDKTTNESEHSLKKSDDLSNSSSDSDAWQENIAEYLETVLQHNQTLLDTNASFEIYWPTYSDSEDWYENGGYLSDTDLFEENALSYAESQNELCEEESENDVDFNKNITNPAFSKYELQQDTTSAYFTGTDGLELAEYSSSLERKSFDNIAPIQASLEFHKEHLLNQNSFATNYTSNSLQMPYNYNYELSDSGSDMEIDSFYGIPDTEIGYDYRPDVYSDLCGNRDCDRCTRMLIYRALDIEPYTEPYCGRQRANHKVPSSHSSLPVESFPIEVKKNATEKNFLDKVSDGIEAVAGFLNKLFK